jgi:hypothetical protein
MSGSFLFPVSFEFPLVADELVVSNGTYKKLEEMIVKAFEKALPVQVGEFGGMKIYSDRFLPDDTGLMLGPDPDFPGQKKILKIFKFTS